MASAKPLEISKVRILWLGSVLDENTVLNAPAVSPAANRWQSGLIGALWDIGCDVQMLGHRPEPVWPRGALYVPGTVKLVPMAEGGPQTCQHLTGYLNVYKLRDMILGYRYINVFRRMIKNGEAPLCVLSYNIYPSSYAVGREAMRCGIPWIPIVADASGDPVKYQKLSNQIRFAAGCVFLSWHSFTNWPDEPKIHLDGGVAALPDLAMMLPDSNSPKIVFYSGVLNRFGGVDLLLDAFSEIRSPDVRLWICGKGDNPKLREALQNDHRITFHGCVDEKTLQQLSRQAWVMVNPRPKHVIDSLHNFPSKILEYLSYGKPIVSTWTPGIAPKYRSVLIVPDAETPVGLAHAIDSVLQWSESQCRERSLAIRRFLEIEKTWHIQAEKLKVWVLQQQK